MSWRSLVLGFMRVPHEPEPPPGSPPKIFRAAKNFLTLRIVEWLVLQLILLLIPTMLTVLIVATAGQTPPPARVALRIVLVIAWSVYVVHLLLGWVVLRLNFELRWYMLSDRAIRIREGVVFMREKTMALANVQNISVKQGPLQRLLGIADVEVRTAGGGSGSGGSHGKGRPMGEPMHVAFFRGVDNAEEIRELVREGVRRQKDAGLGDADDHHALEVHAEPPAIAISAAAGELLEEARALRAALER
jgi:uncharacterized membrane protein YdbT with pleckstrin-like domain